LSFQGTDQAYRLFQARDFARPAAPPMHLGGPGKSEKIPGFLVRRESALGSSFASLRALLSRQKVPYSSSSRYIYRNASLTGFHAPALGFFNSLLVHIALILVILFAPTIISMTTPALYTAIHPDEVIYYPIPEHHAAVRLPRIAPRGPGGRPGSGNHPKLAPEPGKTVTKNDLTVISKPLHPDNFHQTIVQPNTPPEVRIPNDLKLPNLTLGSPDAPKKPMFDLNIKKPSQENSKLAAQMAAPKAEGKTDLTMATMLQPTNSNPKLPIPLGTISKPTEREIGTDATTGSDTPDVGVAGYGKTVLAIGIDPSGPPAPDAGVTLPPGNRWGEFSIAPGAGTAGSPGGRATGAPGGGGGGQGQHAGDESVGIGPSHEGGGGGKEGSPSRISIQGKGSTAGGVALLDPLIEAKTIIPVIGAARVPRARMVVSAGPVGGGGLGVYGALPCSKIYTIFLPMPSSSWTMQYCQKSAGAEAPKQDPDSTVITLEQGVVPPDPDLTSRYDFKRLPVPPGKGEKLIVLKGTLKEDGSVQGLQVYQGIVPEMDEAARQAFMRWKFKPAMRAGKPVALEILVGISPETIRSGNSQ